APLFPNVFNYLPGAGFPSPPTITALTPNYRTPYIVNSSIQISRQLARNDSLTVGYVNTGARDLTYERDLNLINPVRYLADGRPVYSSSVNAFTRLYPQFNGIKFEDTGATANYNALIVSYLHRWSAGFETSMSYTWSHSLSDAPDLYGYDTTNALLEDPTNRRRDYGNAIVNRPNAFTLSSVFNPSFSLSNGFWNRLANGNELTLLANLSSGDAQTITTSTDLISDPASPPQRPLYVGRDTVRTPNIYQVDMRYTRTLFTIRERFRTKLLAEANNVFNTRNVTSTNVTAVTNSAGVITGAPTLAPTSTILEGRLIQLGIRADW